MKKGNFIVTETVEQEKSGGTERERQNMKNFLYVYII